MNVRHLILTAATVALVSVGPTSGSANDAAKALAERFSEGSSGSKAKTATQKPTVDVEARRKSDEHDMLERARREAAEAKADANAEATPVAAPVVVSNQEAERKAELKRLAEKLRLAREARESKKLAEKRAGEATAHAEAPIIAPTAPAPSRDIAARETPRAMERREFWKPDVSVSSNPERTELDISSRSGLGARPRDVNAGGERVAVLLVMAPGAKGIRRFNKVADPIICTSPGCYVSTGTATPANLMPHHKATGLGNTFGKRAGACSQSLECVFRDIELSGSTATIQPIDLKMMVHDRREAQVVSADRTCRVTAGRLSCGKPVSAGNYVMWVVPEYIAERAGADVLARAVSEGLPAPDQRVDDALNRALR
jgi:hypothetical protein